MRKLKLSTRVRRELEHILAHSPDARQLKRAQAVLWFSEGMRVETIAQQLRSSRQSIYNWIDRIDQSKGSVEQRLKDAVRPGRPADKRQLAAQAIPGLLEVSPQDRGYRATGWTNRLLRDYLLQHHHVEISRHIVQTVVKQAGYRWKRPRYVLSRRAEHWRQSKGGSSAV
jgi:transposase